ncbi:helix-turn-helix transcriptional regulator [Micromonospora sp. WMMD967]|uniref:helix-turn-helix domain-containing protein n=1 Tax=Micromonospora sp. WMMD967 TaxID=3016101 RepID=UPI0024175262|nr:helix-turn-helix transcriptional regulator [Micromonospora sp. WMMD967]MDG4838369.1 helix-turn-helix transcriptional regulator [Micromonospora sp. WMMD967]
MGDSDEISAARRALGRRLAHLRKAAGLTQHGLAPLVWYARSSIASIETSRQQPERTFWNRCDTILRTGGVLTAEYDRIIELDLHRQRAQADTSAASSEVLGDPEECITARRSALIGSTDDDARLTHLELEIQRAIIDIERFAPCALVARLRPLRGCVDELMAAMQHPPQRARLYMAAAHLSGLLATLALDLRAFRIARAYAAELYDLAVAAEQPDVLAWAHATQRLIANHGSDPQESLADTAGGLGQVDKRLHRFRVVINGLAGHLPASAIATTSSAPPEVPSRPYMQPTDAGQLTLSE